MNQLYENPTNDFQSKIISLNRQIILPKENNNSLNLFYGFNKI